MSMIADRNMVFGAAFGMTGMVIMIAWAVGRILPSSAGELQLLSVLLVLLSPLPVLIAVSGLRLRNDQEGNAALQSIRDPLTKLYNQDTFWDLLEYETERSVRQNYRFSLLHVDLDNFKVINDRYGHDAGDSFLVRFTEIFREAIRKGDIAARYGGDNFTAILPVCDEEQAQSAARRILESLRRHAHVLPDGTAVRITASIGVAVYPDHAQNGGDLFLLADSMLKQAKTGGKDRYSVPSDQVNFAELRSAGAKSILIMEALRAKRIVPYFQPIISVKQGTLLAYEVLTRIVLPDRVVPAAEFIEEAEGMGAIGRISQLIFERAFALARQEQYQGRLFFNISPRALATDDFIPSIRKLIRDYAIMPSQIVFEITERDTVKNLKLLEERVQGLKDEGFRFAIDDFGSGYASFRYIKAFSVDYLKVDGAFVRHMAAENHAERAIVSSIASLAGSLGIETIAEYVESESILGNVESVGIDYAQGYYIQHPSPHLSNGRGHATA